MEYYRNYGTGNEYVETNQADIDYPSDAAICLTCAVRPSTQLPQSSMPFMPNSDSGITDHSSDERYFITSIDRNNKLGLQAFIYWLENNNITYKWVMGKFDGKHEYSFVINARNWDKVRNSGFISRQDWVLYLWPHAYGYARYGVDARRATMYATHSAETHELGVFVAINAIDHDDYDEWSYDVDADQYYVTKTKEQLK